MKSKYVLLTALSALVVGMGGANAADGLQVATKSYSDTHLASKDIVAPTTDEKNKVVTVNDDATGFTYTTAPSAGNGISKSTANAFSVKAATTSAVSVGSSGVDVKVDGTTITKDATDGTLSATQTTYSAGNGVNLTGTSFAVKPYNGINVDANGVSVKPKASTGAITVDGNGVAVNVDGSTIKVNANNKLEAQVMVGMTSDADGKAGLVPAPKRQTDDFVKFLRGDGTWAADRDTTYQAGAGLGNNNNTFSVNVDNSTIKINSESKLVAQQMTAASSSAAGTAGLVPAPAAGKQNSFLRGDGTWVVPTNTTYSAGSGITKSSGNAFSVNVDNATIKVNGSGNLEAQQMTAASSSAAGTAGIVPAPGAGKQSSFLRGDGTWVVPTNTTYSAGSGIGLSGTTFSAKVDGVTIKVNGSGNMEAQQMAGATATAGGKTGLVPAPVAGNDKSFLRGDGTWVVPTDTTYTAGSGMNLSSGAFAVKPKASTGAITADANGVAVNVDNSTIKVNSSNKLEAQQMAGATASAAGAKGLVPAPAAGEQAKILSGAGTWVDDNNTTYSAGNGVTLTDTTFAVKPYNGINVTANGVGVKAYNGINVTSSGVGVKAVANGGINVTSDGVSVDKNAVFGTTGCSNGQRCALTLELSSSGVPTYKWYPLTNPDGTLSN